jgi:hypothetical protein
VCVCVFPSASSPLGPRGRPRGRGRGFTGGCRRRILGLFLAKGGRPEDFIEAVALILGTSFIGLGSNFLSFADMGAASISLACNYYSQNTTRVREGAQLTHKTSQHNEDADT